MKEIFGSLQKPMLFLSATTLEDYIFGFEILGHITGRKQRADELVKYAQSSLNLVPELQRYIAQNNVKKPTIYYAQGTDGLISECEGSLHSVLIELAGAQNVHRCGEQKGSAYGRVKISFEQLLGYQPDIILIYEREFYELITHDPKWQLLSAIKNGRFYLIPREPFSWFDRPPSFMRFLGLKWLINLTHPQAFKFNITHETREFYRLFLQLELTDAQIAHILDGSGVLTTNNANFTSEKPNLKAK